MSQFADECDDVNHFGFVVFGYNETKLVEVSWYVASILCLAETHAASNQFFGGSSQPELRRYVRIKIQNWLDIRRWE